MGVGKIFRFFFLSFFCVWIFLNFSLFLAHHFFLMRAYVCVTGKRKYFFLFVISFIPFFFISKIWFFDTFPFLFGSSLNVITIAHIKYNHCAFIYRYLGMCVCGSVYHQPTTVENSLNKKSYCYHRIDYIWINLFYH